MFGTLTCRNIILQFNRRWNVIGILRISRREYLVWNYISKFNWTCCSFYVIRPLLWKHPFYLDWPSLLGLKISESLNKHTISMLASNTLFDNANHTDTLLSFNTLRPRQNGRHFADDTFKRIFVNENIRISIKFSLKFVPKGPINNIPALVQIMAWRRPGDKPLSESVMVSLLTHICVAWPQWGNIISRQLQDILRPRQVPDILKCIFLNENIKILIKVSSKFLPKDPINNIRALV